MKRSLEIIFATLSILVLVILACTNKEINLVTNVDLNFDQNVTTEGFVNDLLPATLVITPEKILPEFEYYFRYEVLEGQGIFLDTEDNVLPANENIILTKEATENNFTLNLRYQGLSAGNHRVRVIASDNFDKKIERVLNYTIENIPVVWTAVANTDQIILGNSVPATLTLQNNTGAAITFERSFLFTKGSGQILDNNNNAIQLGQTAPITPGVYQITIAPTQLGTNTINFNLEDSNGQLLTASITITVVEESTNLPPTVAITATPVSGIAPLTVQFNANASDPNGDTLTYAWDFGDGNTSTEENPTHQYMTANATPYTATLTVSDGTDTGNDTIEITVNDVTPGNTPPTVSITATPTSGTAPLDVAFTASITDLDAGDVFTYAWDFGDGNTSNEENPTHQYGTASATPYTATLTVSDGTDTGNDTIEITVNDVTPGNTPPTVSITATPTSGTAPLDVAFTASITDPDVGDIFTYDWDFGDGSTSTEENPTHQYMTANATPYTVVLTVSDGLDTGNDTIEITINPITNTAPIAQDDSANAIQGVSITINVLGNDSDSDGDGLTIDSVEDPLNGTATINTDGTIEYTSNANYEGNDAFDYTITDGNLTATARVTIMVAAAPNNPPVINDIITTATSGFVPFPVNFVADATDPDTGDTLTYTWDFGDGSPLASGSNTSHEFTTGGTFTVTLTVSDGTDSVMDTVTINATENQLPTAVININGILSENDGAPDEKNFNATGSTDPDGSIVEYQWNFGDPGSTGNTITETSNGNVNHTYNNPGTYTVTLTVVDNNGGEDTDTLSIEIEEPNTPPTVSNISRNVNYNTSITINIADVASDPDPGDTITFNSMSPLNTSDGTNSFNAARTVLRYSAPPSGSNRSVTILFDVIDSNGAVSDGEVTINLQGSIIVDPCPGGPISCPPGQSNCGECDMCYENCP